MLKYRIYTAFLLGAGFTALVFVGLTSFWSNFVFRMAGIELLMPGIGLLGIVLPRCCESALPMLVANAFIYSGGAFLLILLLTRNLQKGTVRPVVRRFTLVVVGVFALGCVITRVGGWALAAPNDELLTRRFNNYRSDFETLALMAEQDAAISRVADDFLWRTDSVAWPRPEAEWGITKDRWKEYRRLFKRVGLDAGLSKNAQGNIYFIAHTEGSVVSGASKGFVYCQKTGTPGSTFLPCTEQRDSGRSENSKGEGSEYHRLAEHWFIYSDWD